MENKRNEKIDMVKRALKKRDFINKAICFVWMKMGFSNYRLQALEIRNKNFNYLKKKYFTARKRMWSHNASCCVTKKIWMCWLQGEDEAPKLVKVCFDSVRRYMPDWELAIISEKNIFEYIALPDYVVEKWKKGIITNTIMADIIRTELLIKYGGMWIDATVLLTNKVPEYIWNKDFFVYTHSFPDDITFKYNNWLIYAERDNPVLKEIISLIYNYWKKENYLKEYFMWQLFATMIAEQEPEYFKGINHITDEMPSMLANVFFDKFDEKYWSELLKITPVHKLSNKFVIESDISNTYYERLIDKCDFI